MKQNSEYIKTFKMQLHAVLRIQKEHSPDCGESV